jgi:hypothetical protein
LASVVLTPLWVLVSGHIYCAWYQPRIGVRAEGDRLYAEATGRGLWSIRDWHYAQATGLGSQPMDVIWPTIPTELLAKSETQFFDRLSAMPVTFARDARGAVTRLIIRNRGKTYAYDRVSDEPPKTPELPKPRVAINLNAELLDAYIGQYYFPPHDLSPSGIKMTIWREGDQLVGQVHGDNVIHGAFDIYPESETSFFLKIDGSRLVFTKNSKGEVTKVAHQMGGREAIEGAKLTNK